VKAYTGYQCDHCSKRMTGKTAAKRMRPHERHCWRNPHRTPREGEVYGHDHAPADYSIDEDDPPDWMPDVVGSIYVDGGWRPVPGYTHEKTHTGGYDREGNAVFAEYGDTWPQVWNGEELVPMNTLPRHLRIEWWRACEGVAA